MRVTRFFSGAVVAVLLVLTVLQVRHGIPTSGRQLFVKKFGWLGLHPLYYLSWSD